MRCVWRLPCSCCYCRCASCRVDCITLFGWLLIPRSGLSCKRLDLNWPPGKNKKANKDKLTEQRSFWSSRRNYTDVLTAAGPLCRKYTATADKTLQRNANCTSVTHKCLRVGETRLWFAARVWNNHRVYRIKRSASGRGRTSTSSILHRQKWAELSSSAPIMNSSKHRNVNALRYCHTAAQLQEHPLVMLQ